MLLLVKLFGRPSSGRAPLPQRLPFNGQTPWTIALLPRSSQMTDSDGDPLLARPISSLLRDAFFASQLLMPLSRSQSLTAEEILKTAHATVSAFISLGIQGCFFGSVACLCYGATRVPNDVDVVITSVNPIGGPWDPEHLKDLLVQTDQSFYVISSRNPSANYRLLYYDLSGSSRVSRELRRCCKVDVLVPGSMNIPPIPSSRVVWQLEERYSPPRELPVLPFILLLLMKLQGWMDHGNSQAVHKKEKQPTDVRDIRELLALSAAHRTANSNAWSMMKSEGWVPQSFVNQGQMRVREFVRRYPDTEKAWRQIGLGYLPVTIKFPSGRLWVTGGPK